MSSKVLWIGGLPGEWTADMLKYIFQNARISPPNPLPNPNLDGLQGAKIMMDPSKTNYKYGFLEFKTNLDAMEALSDYNGRNVPGTTYFINLDWGKENQTDHSYSLFVDNLPPDLAIEDFKHTIREKCLEPPIIEVELDPYTRRCSGKATINLNNKDDFNNIIRELNGKTLNKHKIQVSFGSQKKYLDLKKKNEAELPVLPDMNLYHDSLFFKEEEDQTTEDLYDIPTLNREYVEQHGVLFDDLYMCTLEE